MAVLLGWASFFFTFPYSRISKGTYFGPLAIQSSIETSPERPSCKRLIALIPGIAKMWDCMYKIRSLVHLVPLFICKVREKHMLVMRAPKHCSFIVYWLGWLVVRYFFNYTGVLSILPYLSMLIEVLLQFQLASWACYEKICQLQWKGRLWNLLMMDTHHALW